MQYVATKRLFITEFLNPAGISFVIYVVVLIYPDITASPLAAYFAYQFRITLANQTYLMIAVPILLAGMTLFVWKSCLQSVYRNQTEFIFTVIFSAAAILLFVVTGSSNPLSGYQWLQYIITVYFYYLCICFWGADALRVKLALISAAIAIAGILSLGLIIHGLPQDRFVGLLHPNYFARCAFTAMMLYSVATKRVSLYVVALCVSACYIVSGRTILFSSILFYASYLICAVLPFRAHKNTLLVLLICCFAIPVCMFVLLSVDLNPIIDRIWINLGFADLARGVGSGFTGRADSWQYFFDDMHRMVFFGYGFRSMRYGLNYVHSGILSYFMDFGLVLGTILLLAVVFKGVSILRFGFITQDHGAIIAGLSVLTTLLIQFLEPDNFNIGYVGSVFFMLVLGYNSQLTAKDHAFVNMQMKPFYRRHFLRD